jgi:PKD domain
MAGAVLALLAVLAVGCQAAIAAAPSITIAAAPSITIAAAFSGSATDEQTPTFSGTTNDILDPVVLKIYEGASATGPALQTLTVTPVPFELLPAPGQAKWSAAPATPLASGQYTALAEQTSFATHTGKSPAVTFTVDASPPRVDITSPSDNAILTTSRPTFSGVADQSQGDRQAVSLSIYAGSSASGSPVAPALVLTPAAGAWTSATAGPRLANGIYTAEASQSDELGAVGVSAVTFAISAPNGGPQAALTASASPPAPPPASAAPAASFEWFPAQPHTGEAVVLTSTSTDPDSALSAFAWDLTGTGAFDHSGAALSTSFARPGAHVVRLRVTDARGLSSVASETITVARAPARLMAPYPVVRIADTVSSSRVEIRLLTVQAPVGATVAVRCRGRGCPGNSTDVVVTSRRSKDRSGDLVAIAFRRFERALQAGATLQITVFERGEIGKYTRFGVRRGKLPVRLDTCLGPTRATPIVCPLS